MAIYTLSTRLGLAFRANEEKIVRFLERLQERRLRCYWSKQGIRSTTVAELLMAQELSIATALWRQQLYSDSIFA
jgi:hypothetical protein